MILTLLLDNIPSPKRYREVLLKDPCVWCGYPQQVPSIEHITPKSKGGHRSSLNNQAGACRQCNNKRGNLGLVHFLVWRQNILHGPARPCPECGSKFTDIVTDGGSKYRGLAVCRDCEKVGKKVYWMERGGRR